jgi:glycosyltransferase involved in cell wall biosynthesis
MKNPVISILVPVYNVSDFIEKCAHSLFNQTFEDIEYVFVNDCTPDDSIQKLQKVLEQYPNRKAAVKLINNLINRGSGMVRQIAIDNALGKYVLFVDADDWIEPEMVEILYNKALKEDADIVVSDVFIENNKENYILKQFVSQSREENVVNLITQEVIAGYLPSRLINRELFFKQNDIFVEGLNYLEDCHAITRLFYHARKVAKVDRAFYHYCSGNPNSIVKNKNRQHFENVIFYRNELDKFLKQINLYDKYAQKVEFGKVRNKVRLIFNPQPKTLRREYSWLYRDFEMKYISSFASGERIILFCTHCGFYRLAHLAYLLIFWKNK